MKWIGSCQILTKYIIASSGMIVCINNSHHEQIMHSIHNFQVTICPLFFPHCFRWHIDSTNTNRHKQYDQRGCIETVIITNFEMTWLHTVGVSKHLLKFEVNKPCNLAVYCGQWVLKHAQSIHWIGQFKCYKLLHLRWLLN